MVEQNQILFDRLEKLECPSCRVEMDVAALEPFSRAACPSCGAEVVIPAKLSGYRLLACLGSGGMGSVYRAYDETLDREVAIKIMKKSLGSQPEFLESFRREAQAAAKLNHPNIAQIYSFGEEKGQPYIVMEYVPGKHLEDLIENEEPLAQDMVMKIGMDIADGLQLATASNLVHGDIKPGNILLDGRDSPKLVDFGIASSPDAEQTEIWGTPYYISPEKIKREKIDFRSDMYCLGGTLYHALTKHPPFDGDDAVAVVKARLTTPPKPLREFRPDISPEAERIILKMLEREPMNRYASYGELMADIKGFLESVQKHPVGASSGGASKRIIIKGRTKKDVATPSAPEAAAAPAEEPAPATGGGRIRIQKKRGSMALHAPGDSADAAVEPATEDKPPEKSSLGKKVLIALAVVVVLAALGVGLLLHFASAAKAKARDEKIALIAGQGTELATIMRIGANAQSLSGKIGKYGETAGTIVDEAVKTVEKALGSEWAARIVAEEPFEFPPFDDSLESDLRGAGGEEKDSPEEPASGEEGGAASESEGGAASGLPEELLALLPEEAREIVKKAEAGEISPEEALAAIPQEKLEELAKAFAGGVAASLVEALPEQMRAMVDAFQAGAMGTGGDEESETEGSDDAEEPGMDELAEKAREIFLTLAPIRKAEAFAPLAIESIGALAVRAVGATNIEADVETASFDVLRAEVDGNTALLKQIAKKASERYGEIEDMVDGFEGIIKSARKELDALKTAAVATIAENERRIAEEKAAEEARIERERREAEEAARRAAEEAEIEKVRSIVPAAMGDVLKWKFDHILRDLGKLDGTLKFKTAQKALKVEKRRVEGLAALKAFLVSHLNGEDKFAHRRDKWSVLSANDRTVEIKPRQKDAKPVKMKWEELAPEQIVPILMYYLQSKDKAKEIPLRERNQAYVNAAVYFMTVRGDDENARKAAAEFAERVIQDSPSRKADAIDTLYELELGDEE